MAEEEPTCAACGTPITAKKKRLNGGLCDLCCNRGGPRSKGKKQQQ